MHLEELCSFLICMLTLGYQLFRFAPIMRVLATRLALRSDVAWMCKFFDLECSR